MPPINGVYRKAGTDRMGNRFVDFTPYPTLTPFQKATRPRIASALGLGSG
ncbi:hypothetical protein FHS31_001506 [Sphingomonas vulcanisoli]|uniref:Uncharacterized protein n=1 Tax=Sphingomonas vulcanisoli TaxID=1658060 RepID=A0ABX0TR32_9SPHN|nr:hypothetical protein [Sphingomonas vulcanisoli]